MGSWAGYWAQTKYLPEAHAKIRKHEKLLISLKRCKSRESMLKRIDKFEEEMKNDS